MLVSILCDAGARCTQASNVDDATAHLALQPCTVIVSDIGLPNRDGLELMRDLRAASAPQAGGTPAVALTAGFDAHVGKPLDAKELVAVGVSVVARTRR